MTHSMPELPLDPVSDSLEERVVSGLSKISMALKSQSWQNAGSQGLTPTQGQILALLKARGGAGVRLSEVAQALGVKPATASDAVSILVDKVLVQKQRAADDGRAIALTLTPQGEQQAQQIGGWSAFLIEAVADLSREEKQILLQILIKMIQKLQGRGQIPIAHMCVTCRYFHPHTYEDPRRPHHCAYVDAPFGEAELQLDCPDHQPRADQA